MIAHQATSARMEVHPSVLFRLGEDLITDEIQALLELIKNAYDADSDIAVIRIVTDRGPDQYPDDNGYVEVIDRGHGMTLENIRAGWLTVSNSIKRQMKDEGRTTPGGRIPLGDKGLGRLGAQRLGHRLTIETTPQQLDIRHRLSFDWRDFESCQHLSEMELEIHTSPSHGKIGTTIMISDLRNPGVLSNAKEIERSLTKIISPYRGVSTFRLSGSVNGHDLDPSRLEDSLRRAAVIHYDLLYASDDELTVSGRMRLNHLRPIKKADRQEYERICESDGGASFLDVLMRKPKAKDFRIEPSSQAGWWIDFATTTRLCELTPHLLETTLTSARSPSNAVSRVEPSSPSLTVKGDDSAKRTASPGPFIGEIDFFNFGSGAAERMEGFDNVSALRAQVRDLGGVRIYRDGFNIRIEGDWLGLGQAWTSGGSWYGLRPGNTLGYIELTTRDNRNLVETTDREGFSRTPHYDNFMKIMKSFIDSSNEILEFIGREWSTFRNSISGSNGGAAIMTPRRVTSRLTSTLANAPDHRKRLETLGTRLAADVAKAKDSLPRPDEDTEGRDDHREKLLSSLQSLAGGIETAATVADDLQSFVADLESQMGAGERLQAEFDSLEEQLLLTYETMGVGLTAEALSHEIANVADRLLQATNRVERHVKEHYPDDPSLLGYISHVRGSVTALRRQLSHLAPMLRHVRERKEPMLISDVLHDTREYFDARWREDEISLTVTITEDTAIVANRGKLLQVFDNLLLNSEYWLREELRAKRMQQCNVMINVDGSSVRVSDDGPGVAPEIEHSLFEAFTTRKPKDQGRGLGLFISSQLLETDGCSMRLGSNRNRLMRRYEFELDLGGVVAV